LGYRVLLSLLDGIAIHEASPKLVGWFISWKIMENPILVGGFSPPLWKIMLSPD
jgi:hypothetical protein